MLDKCPTAGLHRCRRVGYDLCKVPRALSSPSRHAPACAHRANDEQGLTLVRSETRSPSKSCSSPTRHNMQNHAVRDTHDPSCAHRTTWLGNRNHFLKITPHEQAEPRVPPTTKSNHARPTTRTNVSQDSAHKHTDTQAHNNTTHAQPTHTQAGDRNEKT